MSDDLLLRPIVIGSPAAIHIGPGTAAEVGRAAAARGITRALVVADPFNASRIDHLALDCRVETFADLPGEPDTRMLAAARTLADGYAPDLVVGFGGGSAMDLAKLVAVLAGSELRPADIVGVGRTPARKAMLAQVPTTAGTGSESGTRALVTDAENGAKLAVESPEMLADLVALDPHLAVTLPPQLTAETGIDALAHCVESFTSARSHPVIDLYAREGIRLIGRYLHRAVKDGGDLEARTGMALAALYGGYCLGPVNTTAGHAIAYPLSTRHGIAHGRANAIIFPHTLAFNATMIPERTTEILSLLGLEAAGPNAVFEVAHRFCRDLGIDMRLTSEQVAAGDLEAMASEAAAIRRLLDHNPRPVTRDDILHMYRAVI